MIIKKSQSGDPKGEKGTVTGDADTVALSGEVESSKSIAGSPPILEFLIDYFFLYPNTKNGISGKISRVPNYFFKIVH